MWHHPKYYKELRKRNKSDQAISKAKATAASERATGPGLEVEIIYQDLSSLKLKASSKPQAPSSSKKEPQAASPKQQASSSKPQATSS